MNDDNFYIEQFLSGKDEGFEELVRRYQDRVMNIVYSLVRRDMESEDIAQEVFLKVYRGLKHFRRQSRFSTWLYRIAVNTTYDFLRRRKGILGGDPLPDICADSPGPRDELLAGEKEKMVRLALSKVPFKFSSALVLKEVEGLSYMEIAETLGCGIGTVESRIFRARQLLKKEIIRLEG